MALASTVSRVSFAGNGSTTVFSFPYYFLANADLIVVLRTAAGVESTRTITTHYTVSGAGVPAGGTVTMVTAPITGETLILYRDPAITQDLDLVENDPLPAEELEKRFDKATMIDQRLKDRLDRSLRLTDGYSAAFTTTLPTTLTADAILVINPTANGIVLGPTLAVITTAGASASAASASASAASSSAGAASTSAGAAATSASAASTSAGAASTSASAAAASVALLALPLAATSGGTSFATYATGDLLFASGANTLSKLGIGATNHVVRSVAGVPAWAVAQSGGVNYASANPDAETNTAGFITYADAAGALPVDGTGGSPAVTWTRSTSAPLRSAASFLFTKDAVNRQGNGASFDFTIDSTDQAKMLTIAMDYKVASGTYASGDLTLYIFDVTNSLVIQPAGFTIQDVLGSLVQRATFQTASNSTSYRLCWHVASVSTVAYSLNFDNISIGPTALVQGTPVSDWTAVTMTHGLTGGTNTVTAFEKLIGDTAFYKGKILFTGVFTGGGFTLNLPSGRGIDTAKVSDTGGAASILGSGTDVDVSAGLTVPLAITYSSTAAVGMRVLLDDSAASTAYSVLDGQSTTLPFVWANSDYITFEFSVPIVGRSSNVQMSSDTDTRVVAFKASNSVGFSTPNNSTTAITGWTTIVDTHGGFSSDTYVIRVPGVYDISALASFDGNATGLRILSIQVGGIGVAILLRDGGSVNGNYLGGSTLLNLVAGNVVRLAVFQNSGGALTLFADPLYNHWSISRISGPSQIAAIESVNMRASNTAGTSITNSLANVPFVTVAYDSHAAFASPTYTVPVSGKYRVNANLTLASVTNTTTQFLNIQLQKNGTAFEDRLFYGNGAAILAAGTVSGVIDCIAGDTLRVQASNSNTIGLNTTAGRNTLSIVRVGN